MIETGENGLNVESLPDWAHCFPADFSNGRRFEIDGVEIGPVIFAKGKIFFLEIRDEIGSIAVRKGRYGRPFLTLDGQIISERDPIDEFIARIIKLKEWIRLNAERCWNFYPVMVFPKSSFVKVHYKQHYTSHSIFVVNESFLSNFLDIKTSNVCPWEQIPDDKMSHMYNNLRGEQVNPSRSSLHPPSAGWTFFMSCGFIAEGSGTGLLWKCATYHISL